ncbi:hypothetical protein DBR39_10360 [Chryseobacterium sp. KBW03]|nr:hypothetical protein DBR39_10360 [Chryseobacterium sp. KBW03]
MTVAYARVSTSDQNISTQVEMLYKFTENIKDIVEYENCA